MEKKYKNKDRMEKRYKDEQMEWKRKIKANREK